MNKAKNIIRVAILTLFTVFVFTGLLVGFNTVFPPNCERCHTGDEARLRISATHSAHKGQSCVSCHAGKNIVDRVAFSAQTTYSMIIPVFNVQNYDAPSSYDAKCEGCHANLSGVTSNNGIRINHLKCASKTSCVKCHGTTGHSINGPVNNVTYTMDACFECHKDISSDKKCTLCHAGRSSQSIKATSSWQVTHGPNWKRTHGMGNLNTCSVCHADSMCAKCHGVGVPHNKSFFSDHGKMAQDKKQNCTSCHETTFCTNCHGDIEMPHPKGFLKQHSSVATKDNDPACLICHAKTDCTNCHAKHIHPGGAKTSYQRAKGGR